MEADTNRDAAEFIEAQVPPAEVADSLEDFLRDLIAPAQLTDEAIKKIATAYLDVQQTTTPTNNLYRDILEGVLKHVHPAEFTILDWWAIQFIGGFENRTQINPTTLSKALNVDKTLIHRRIQKWRKIFGHLPPSKELNSQSKHITWRERRKVKLVAKT